MKPTPTAIAVIACALLVFWPGLPAAAEDASESPQPEQIYFETTNVNVVNVEVFVTDKRGNPVTGLTAEDFELFESGQPMEISNFYAVAGGQPVVETPAAAEPAAEPAARPRLEPIAVPEEQRLHLIIYVDNFNIRPANRNRVLHRMHRFLHERLGRDDRVMVVSYDRSLHVRQPFTTDKGLVAEALESLEELSGSQTLRDADRLKTLEEIEVADDEYEAMVIARFYADSIYAEMDFVVGALEDHVEALSGLVGRKALLYVSDGLPKTIAEDVFMFIDEKFKRTTARLDAFAYDYTHRFREVIAKANAGGVTFYTLDSGGMSAHQSISAEFGGTRAGGGMSYVDSIRSANLQAPLYMLADDTGGKAIVNTNAVDAGLGKIAADFDNYYSIGYQAPHYGSGRFYKVEVKVKQKGLQVRHRRGYRDKTPEARLTDGSIASLHFGFESNPLGAGLEFGRSSPQVDGGKNYLLPMTVKIPLGELALAPQEGYYLGRVKLSVVVMDGDGRLSPVQQQEPVSIQIPAADIERARGQFFAYDLTLAVRKGFVRIAVGIRDELGSEISFLRQTVNVTAS